MNRIYCLLCFLFGFFVIIITAKGQSAFFNIDIEGHELEVLKSLDFKKYKIKVICVEILDYDSFAINRKRQIISFLKKNKYDLVGKSTINYIFKRR